MKGKVIVLVGGTLVSLFLVVRYVALSRAGVPLGWMLYLGLPMTGVGVLCALRLLELGEGWGADEDVGVRRLDVIYEAPADPPAAGAPSVDAPPPRGRRRFRR
jgi:hypothetical protein